MRATQVRMRAATMADTTLRVGSLCSVAPHVMFDGYRCERWHGRIELGPTVGGWLIIRELAAGVGAWLESRRTTQVAPEHVGPVDVQLDLFGAPAPALAGAR